MCTAPHTGPRLVLYTGVEQLVAAADTLKTDLYIYYLHIYNLHYTAHTPVLIRRKLLISSNAISFLPQSIFKQNRNTDT